ncbi:hypothetical protein [Clostridium sp.]|uniref:hypothetical protein n=1 Tax=Clostridium sp. TaxID=1506 RepID=UPI0026DC240E|nr:hypothetical protein [Clostridium sp.]MDO5040090.1 hypothetical protein [Clostridium sp.]
MEYKNKENGEEKMGIEKKKNDRVQIRMNSEYKAKLKYLSEVRGYKSLSEYILYLAMKDISESEFINNRME